MKKMNNKGFSLIELIIVIAIMAVLVAVIAPNLAGRIGDSKVSTDNSNADTIEGAINTCLQELTADPTIGAIADPTSYTKVDDIIRKAEFDNGKNTKPSSMKFPAGESNQSKVTENFEANVYLSLKKYIDGTGNSARIIPKQDDFEYTIVIDGSYDGGYTCTVKCEKRSTTNNN